VLELVDATTALLAAIASDDWHAVERSVRERDAALALLARGLARSPLSAGERELLGRAALAHAEAMRRIEEQRARLGLELAELRRARAAQPSRVRSARPLTKA
jgi:predicted metal-dependent HD superfamily phosphohydrolase